jgi:hypothetical protein
VTDATAGGRTVPNRRETSVERGCLTPDDDICFHIFQAPSREAVARMTELVNLDHERITEVIE